VWAKTTKVGFAVRDNIAILGYCKVSNGDKTCYDCTDPAANPAAPDCTPSACKLGTGCETSNLKADGYCDNVKQKGCFKASTDGTGGYNSCYNDKQLKEVNRHRLQHETTPLLTLYVDGAKWLHTELNDPGFVDFNTFKTKVENDATYKVCKPINYATTIDAQYDAGILKYDYTNSDY
jgi:hypothetical protein